jgi:hypothetical protein
MAGPFAQAGAISNPTRYGALTMAGEQFTGLWTQAGPYRDAATSYLIRKFYSGSRFDRMIDGLNREISPRLTDIRRPGNIKWNNNTFPGILSYYSFKFVQNGVEQVHVLVDTASAVYDATNGAKTLIFTKSAGAGKTRFLGVGPTLYMADGVDTKKWVLSSLIWKANTTYLDKQHIVDTNNNLQIAVGAQVAKIVNIQVVAVTGGRVVTLFFDPTTPLDIPNNIQLTLSGLTTVPAANGASTYTASVQGSLQVSFFFAGTGIPVTAFSAETGTATTGTATSGGTMPTWNTTLSLVTQDGGLQWVNRGSAIQNWGFAAPTIAPTATQVAAPSIYSQWAASTWYAPGAFVIIDSNGNVQMLVTSGTTGGAHPTWATVVGTNTTDNTCVWKCLGPPGWAASTAFVLGSVVVVNFTYYTTQSQSLPYPPYYLLVQVPVTVTLAFECIAAGTSGSVAPNWSNGVGTTVPDGNGTLVWRCIGTAPAWPGAAQKLSTATTIQDSNGNLQSPQVTGETAAGVPTWAAASGASTIDGNQTWLNAGPFSPANTGAWTWAYSGKNSVTGEISTASPLSVSLVVAKNMQAVIQGPGIPGDPQIDTIVLWRTAQGQSTLVYEDEFPNPAIGSFASTWIYTDTTPDVSSNGGPQLNPFISAPVADANDPPPVGFTGPVLHLARIWGFYNNVVQYSGGPDTLAGSGLSAFPPLNAITYQAKIIRILPITVENGGLLVFTSSGIEIVLGTGTASNPFYSTDFCDKIVLGGFDVLDVLGTAIYLMESNLKVSSLTIEYPFSPQSGYSEIGFPIGDQFVNVTGTGATNGNLYNATTAFLSWNIQNTGDTGMYVADNAVGWFRLSFVNTPESGLIWSPRAAIVGGTTAVQSIETQPGVFTLLIGPPASGGPILQRETTATGFSYADNGTAYSSFDVKGVNLLCTTGQFSEVAHISAKSAAVGARPTVSVLMGEIAPSTQRPWDVLTKTSNDPADTPKSQSVFSDRYSLAQNGAAYQGDCIMTKFDYGTQAVQDELLDWGIYGSVEDERKESAERVQ